MTGFWKGLVAGCLALGAGGLWLKYRQRNMQLWFPPWLRREWPRCGASEGGPVHVFFCVADHFEPMHGRTSVEEQRRRVGEWVETYAKRFSRFRDADGRPPRHTFFYPAETAGGAHLDMLRSLVASGFGEVEVHLHHDHDTAAGLREKLEGFLDRLEGRGLVGRDGEGRRRFAFVHGNWALDNSRPDGRWCGVNNELQVLRDCGCYADLTFPSAPSATQPRTINAIYRVIDDPERPRSYDSGVHVSVGGATTGDLMLIQGPLTMHMSGGRLGFLPRLENGNLAGPLPLTKHRVDAWVKTGIGVAGKPGWVFVKVHTHGCDARNHPFWFGEAAQRLHEILTGNYNSGRFRLHYCTAREMYNLVRAAESSEGGEPDTLRDYEILPPSTFHTRQNQEIAT